MDATDWDERYRSSELVWGAAPNRWVVRELSDLAPGTAVDFACGEGRNALWLATRGWRVIGVDFSAVALQKARLLESHQPEGASPVSWVHADAVSYHPGAPADLALLCYLQLPAGQRRAAVRNAALSLAPGGTLLVVGHDSTNIAEGTGGPQDPRVLFTAEDVVTDLEGLMLRVERAEAVLRDVDGAPRPAIDALVRAVRP